MTNDKYTFLISLIVYELFVIIWFVKEYIFRSYIEKRKFKSTYKPNNSSRLGGTMTFNGTGTSFFGGFRYSYGTTILYEFIVIFGFPIIPIGCYRVGNIYEDPNHINGLSSKYKYSIYGNESWNIMEIIYCYLDGWIFKSLILGAIYVIYCIYRLITNSH